MPSCKSLFDKRKDVLSGTLLLDHARNAHRYSEPDPRRLHAFLTFRRIEVCVQPRLWTDMPGSLSKLLPQNSNGIDSTVARLSLGMKWTYRLVVFGSRCPTNAAIWSQVLL